MPEPSGRQKPSASTLSKVHDAGELARVRCAHCNIVRHYYPTDLQKLAGDLPAAAIQMRCEKCGKTEWMRANLNDCLPPNDKGSRFGGWQEFRWCGR